MELSNSTVIRLCKTNIITLIKNGVMHLENDFIFYIKANMSELFCL